MTTLVAPLYFSLVVIAASAMPAAAEVRIVTPDQLTVGELKLPDGILELKGDPAYGAYLGAECKGCHASGAGNVPKIDGYDRTYFITVMHEYRVKARENETMRLVAGRLSDDEIAALAAYFTPDD